jgi:hypothetical protein
MWKRERGEESFGRRKHELEGTSKIFLKEKRCLVDVGGPHSRLCVLSEYV